MFFKSYTQSLLEKKDIGAFAAGIMKNPRPFFKEAAKSPSKVLSDMASVLDMAGSNLGQSAALLSLTGAIKVAARDKRAPRYAAEVAEKLCNDLLKAFKNAG